MACRRLLAIGGARPLTEAERVEVGWTLTTPKDLAQLPATSRRPMGAGGGAFAELMRWPGNRIECLRCRLPRPRSVAGRLRSNRAMDRAVGAQMSRHLRRQGRLPGLSRRGAADRPVEAPKTPPPRSPPAAALSARRFIEDARAPSGSSRRRASARRLQWPLNERRLRDPRHSTPAQSWDHTEAVYPGQPGLTVLACAGHRLAPFAWIKITGSRHLDRDRHRRYEINIGLRRSATSRFSLSAAADRGTHENSELGRAEPAPRASRRRSSRPRWQGRRQHRGRRPRRRPRPCFRGLRQGLLRRRPICAVLRPENGRRPVQRIGSGDSTTDCRKERAHPGRAADDAQFRKGAETTKPRRTRQAGRCRRRRMGEANQLKEQPTASTARRRSRPASPCARPSTTRPRSKIRYRGRRRVDRGDFVRGRLRRGLQIFLGRPPAGSGLRGILRQDPSIPSPIPSSQ